MAVLFRQTPTRGVFVQPLFDEHLCVFGRTRLPKKERTAVCPLSQFDGVPMVLPSNSPAFRLIIERSFMRAGLELNVVADIDSLPTRMAIAREGSACTILSSSNVLFHKVGKTHRPSPPHRGTAYSPDGEPVLAQFPSANSASIAVYRSILELVRTMVSDKSRGMHPRPVNETAYERSASRYKFRL